MTQLPLDLPVRVARGREDFYLASSNREAVEWIDRWPSWPFHALSIYGPRACGKTHLARVWQTRTGAASIAVEELRRIRLPEGLSAGIVVEHRGLDFDEVALLHLYNAVGQAGGFLLLTSLEPPARWEVSLPDLRSRLRATTAIGVGLPDDTLLAVVLTKMFADRQLSVTPDVISFLVARLERSFEAARRCVASLDKAALATSRAITVRLASAVLNDEFGDIGLEEVDR